MRELLASKRPLLGTFLAIPSPYVVEILASSGFDWLCVDMQHGFVEDGLLPAVLTAAERCGLPVLVRTRWNEPSTIMRALDVGASGVIVPLVNDAQEAARAASAARFPPDGTRSWGRLRPLLVGQSLKPSNDDTVCIAMIETASAVAAAAAIAEVVDGIFVGPSDLSLSVTGVLGGDVKSAIASVADACAAAGIPSGIACATPEAAASAVAAGFRMLTLQWDVSLLASGATALLASVTSAVRDSMEEQ